MTCLKSVGPARVRCIGSFPCPTRSSPISRLAQLYDVFDGGRTDLLLYLTMARQLGARSVLDLGCGTGVFALLASANGLHVIGVDPAEASLNVARARPGAERAHLALRHHRDRPLLRVDLAVMTGNVAQVFLTDADWLATLAGVRLRLAEVGALCTKPAGCGPRLGTLEQPVRGVAHRRRGSGWCGCGGGCFGGYAAGVVPYLYTFPMVRRSSRTRRCGSAATRRTRTCSTGGFRVVEVRDAPDRPGRERVYLAAQATTH